MRVSMVASPLKCDAASSKQSTRQAQLELELGREVVLKV